MKGRRNPPTGTVKLIVEGGRVLFTRRYTSKYNRQRTIKGWMETVDNIEAIEFIPDLRGQTEETIKQQILKAENKTLYTPYNLKHA